jgi:hypothetical protein
LKFSALFCAVAALALVGCSPHPAAAPGAVSDGAGQAPAQRYTYEEHGVFGYTQALSESDRTRGVVSLPMVLVRYDGRRGDMYGFKTQEEDGRWTVMSCREPCGAMKLETYGATHIDTRIMPIEPGSILEAIVQDARNGFLDHGMPGAQQKG